MKFMPIKMINIVHLFVKVKALYEKGQPVLVGTIAVETSELISEMLKKEGIPHESVECEKPCS